MNIIQGGWQTLICNRVLSVCIQDIIGNTGAVNKVIEWLRGWEAMHLRGMGPVKGIAFATILMYTRVTPIYSNEITRIWLSSVAVVVLVK